MVDSDDNALGDMVMIPLVLAARERGVLQSLPMPEGPTRDGICWRDHEPCADVIVWATGFRPALAHLRPLRLREPDGDWTGPGSATLIGVGLLTGGGAGGSRDLAAAQRFPKLCPRGDLNPHAR